MLAKSWFPCLEFSNQGSCLCNEKELHLRFGKEIDKLISSWMQILSNTEQIVHYFIPQTAFNFSSSGFCFLCEVTTAIINNLEFEKGDAWICKRNVSFLYTQSKVVRKYWITAFRWFHLWNKQAVLIKRSLELLPISLQANLSRFNTQPVKWEGFVRTKLKGLCHQLLKSLVLHLQARQNLSCLTTFGHFIKNIWLQLQGSLLWSDTKGLKNCNK